MFNINLPPVQRAGLGPRPKKYHLSSRDTEEYPRWATDGSGHAEALLNINGRVEVTRVQFNYGNQLPTLIGREKELIGVSRRDLITSKRGLEVQLKKELQNN